MTSSQSIEAHITKCIKNDTIVYPKHPINLPLLQQFFYSTILDKMLEDISYNNPIEVLLPEFKMSQKNTQDILQRSHKLEIDMDTFVKRTKNNQIVYHDLTEAMLDGEKPIQTSLSTFDIITIVGITVTY